MDQNWVTSLFVTWPVFLSGSFTAPCCLTQLLQQMILCFSAYQEPSDHFSLFYFFLHHFNIILHFGGFETSTVVIFSGESWQKRMKNNSIVCSPQTFYLKIALFPKIDALCVHFLTFTHFLGDEVSSEVEQQVQV